MEDGASSYRRFLDGEASAFDEVQKLYFDRLTFYINRFTQNLYDAEDLAVDTLLELLIHPNRYNFRTPLKAYLFAIAHNKALNFLRKRDKFRMVPVDEAEELADRTSLEEELLRDERKRALERELAELPAEMREAVHLVFFEGLSYEEAARVMHKNRKQIDNLLTRAKAALRTNLGKEGV
ncbi:MAG: RNA polymerase sigma factor [Oscillospiraceae bacterium]|nr:RNA polymerase sigma factor [Oscillospiraceae bacterium]